MSDQSRRPLPQRPPFSGIGGRPGGPGGFQMKAEKPRDFKGTMGKLFKYISEYKLLVIIVMIFAVASTAFAIAGPKIIGKATTKLFEGIMGKIAGTGLGVDFSYIGKIILFLVGLYLLSSLLLISRAG